MYLHNAFLSYYLQNTFKSFDEQVLSVNYAKKNEIIEGHTHPNKSTLDKLTFDFLDENGNELTFNGNIYLLVNFKTV